MKLLFIYAHLDDETILSYGTILKYHNIHNIVVACLCGNGRKNNSAYKTKLRYDAFIKNMTLSNVKTITFDNYDLSLDEKQVKDVLNKLNNEIKPDIVVTHSVSDLHYEHRLIANEALVIFRPLPTSTVKQLLCTTSQTYNHTFLQYSIFTPNVYVDISNYIKLKDIALHLYSTELLDDDIDNRSIQSVITYNKTFGFAQGTKYSEVYLQIYKLV